MNNHHYNEEDNLWLPDGTSEFSYSDGEEVEERIYRIIKSLKDRSMNSEEVVRYITDWPTEYHLSPLRNNLLRPFSFSPDQTILEIGCGCGAITRQLGETGAKVIAVDGSLRRAKITAERCRDLQNVKVYCDNIQQVSLHEKVNVVTLIGVLEYARLFLEGTDPIQAMLELCKNSLTEDGVLLIAIENQLGLKYFNGASEDHTGRIFDGIQDAYNESSAVTFGKEELKRRLDKAGFSKVEFFYPFPDYKLPQLMLQEAALSQKDFQVGQLIGQYQSRDYSGQENRLFREQECWPVLERNALIGDLSNSFFVVASNSNKAIQQFKGDWLAKTYSVRRRPEYWTENIFTKEENNFFVKKQKIVEGKDSGKKIEHLVGTSEYLQGNIYSLELSYRLKQGESAQAFTEWLGPWVVYLKNQLIHNGTDLCLPGRFIDCTPLNLVRDMDGTFHYIDVEWDIQRPVSLKWMFFRGIINSLLSLPLADLEYILDNRRPVDLIIELSNHYQIGIQEEDIMSLLEEEAGLNETVYLNTSKKYLKDSLEWLYQQYGGYVKITDVIDKRKSKNVYVEKMPVFLQIYYSNDGNYSEACSEIFVLKTDGHYRRFELELHVEQASRIRIDPVNIPTFVELQSIEFTACDENGTERIWNRLDSQNKFSGLQFLNGVKEITREKQLLFLTCHEDPFFEVIMNADRFSDGVYKIRITMAVHKPISGDIAQHITGKISEIEADLEERKQIVTSLEATLVSRDDSINELHSIVQNKDETIRYRDELINELHSLTQSKDDTIRAIEEKLEKAEKQQNQTKEDLSRLHGEMKELLKMLDMKTQSEALLQITLDQVQQEKETLMAFNDTLQKERNLILDTLTKLEQEYLLITNSKSWRYTEPLRAISAKVKSLLGKRG